MGDGGCNVILHHAFVEFSPLLYILSGDDEGSLHLLHALAAMSFFNAAVVGSNDEDGFFQHACIRDGLDDATHIAVQLFQLRIVFGCVVSGLMAYVSGLSKQTASRAGCFSLMYSSAMPHSASGYLL